MVVSLEQERTRGVRYSGPLTCLCLVQVDQLIHPVNVLVQLHQWLAVRLDLRLVLVVSQVIDLTVLGFMHPDLAISATCEKLSACRVILRLFYSKVRNQNQLTMVVGPTLDN